MRALAVKPMVKGSLKMLDIEKPTSGRGEALVRVIRVGLDGTDKDIGNALYGRAPAGSEYLVIGHESFGVVEQVGEGVTNIRQGDFVVATVRRPDSCINCAKGESDFCLTGNYTERGIMGANGYMCEHYTEKEEFLVKIPNEIKAQAVMLEPLSIVEKAMVQTFKIQQRMVWEPKKAVVFGTGLVGLMGAMLLRQRGIDVTSIDRTEKHDARDRVFAEFGIKHVNSRNAPNGILSTIGSDFDIALELTGNPSVVKDAISSTGKNGVCCLLSVTGGSYPESMDMGKWNYDTVLGNRLVFGCVNSNKTHFLQGVSDMQSIERAHPGEMARLITNRMPMEGFTTYDILNDNRQLKTVIEVSKED